MPGTRRDRRALTRLLGTFLRPYTRMIWPVALAQVAQTVAVLYLPRLNAEIIDRGVATGDTGYILRAGGEMIAASAVAALGAVTVAYVAARTAAAVGRDLRAAVFRQVLRCSAREVAHFGAPSLVTRGTNDIQQVQTLVAMAFTYLLLAPVMCLGGLVAALRTDLPLSASLLVILPVVIAIVAGVTTRARPVLRTAQQRVDRINGILREQIIGVRVIRALDRDGYETRRFATVSGDLRGTAVRVGRLIAVMGPALILVMNASGAVVLWFGGLRVAGRSMQIGTVTAVAGYVTQILVAVMMTTFMFLVIPRAQVCAERIAEVLDTRPGVVIATDPVRVMPAPGRVDVRDVTFRYPGAEAPVLYGVDLGAEPGCTTAIVGGTGSGKSTLLHVIARLLETTSGTVRVGGVDVRDLDPAVLTRGVALVPQRAYLFAGTVATNLRYGNPDATDEDLWHALRVARAEDVVTALPGHLDAAVAPGGTNLSGGQRQRLAIARALVRRPDVYLFDDSFAALDHATDAALRSALATEAAYATVIIVAQRVHSVRGADRIVVLDAGRVLGTGTHDELMAGCETYREIVRSQPTPSEIR